MQLSARQIEQFEESGFLIVENALDDADIDPVIADYEEHIDRRAHELLAEGKITQLHEGAPFDKRLALICEESTDIYPEMDIYQLRAKAAFEFLGNERLLDIVEGIVGPEISCNPAQHLRAKLPTRLMPGPVGHVAGWHQDMGVVLDESDPHFILTVWLPMTDATVENGCLQILPRTHGKGLLDHVRITGTGTIIADDEMPDVEPLVLEMEKGSLLLMHKQIPHRSTENRSSGIRWSMDLRYQKTGTPSGRPFYPDFVVRSRSDPDSALTDHGEWVRMWEEALDAEALAAKEGRKVEHHRWQEEPAAAH